MKSRPIEASYCHCRHSLFARINGLSSNRYGRTEVANHKSIVETRQLTKHYGRLPALNDCTLAVQRGEVFGLLGPNGSGKTTLLRLLMGFLRPTRGSATIDGRDCYRDSVAVHSRRLLFARRRANGSRNDWPRCADVFCPASRRIVRNSERPTRRAARARLCRAVFRSHRRECGKS